MPRVKCESCGKIRTVIIDWARPGAGLSLLFEYHVLSLMIEMPVLAVARKVGEHDTRLWRVFKYYVEKIDISNVKNIAMDETSRVRRGISMSPFLLTWIPNESFLSRLGKDQMY